MGTAICDGKMTAEWNCMGMFSVVEVILCGTGVFVHIYAKIGGGFYA